MSHVSETKERITRLNKTRDSIGLKLKSNYSVDYQPSNSPDLTNVTRLETNHSSTKDDLECHRRNESDMEEDEEVHGFNYTNNVTKSNFLDCNKDLIALNN